ncbi:Ig-like domain-containing protein [Halomonas binhaiensis]|uniref:Ig-like domain-containing protein n=1 Tax=Halomonas binhaiensis TaxID=2562282 RepID=A0A856QKP1_9GAMM|nr:Ig-like domain-containing protein [Halomonas binhaiensis]QEM80487.2 Ig-like domain-containing protein [Halomonas binhaiensis]
MATPTKPPLPLMAAGQWMWRLRTFTVSGSAEGVPAGGKVNVELNGNAYEATVADDGTWSVDVAAADVAALADGDYIVIATATDAAGNTGTDQRDFSVAASTDSLPGVSIATIAGDDIVNATEHDQALTISGTTTNQVAGDKVNVELNGNAYEATVAADGTWSVDVAAADVAALADGDYTVMATVTDAAGNEGTDQRDFSVVASADNLPTLEITGPLAGDDIINATEQEQALTVSGTSTKLEAGDRVNVELNGNAYEATVAADGTWSVDVAAVDVAALADGDYTVTAKATDAAGNMAEADHQVTVDVTAPVRVATITGITEDTGIAGDYITSDSRPVISGGTGGAAPYPDIRVEVSLDGGKTWQTASTPEPDGYWEFAVEQDLADGQYEVMARLTDAAGNSSAPDTVTMTVDTVTPTVTIDALAGDDVINATEHGQGLEVTGTTTDLAEGDKVSIELNGKSYEADVAGDGSWSLDVPAEDVAALADGDYTVTASVSDVAGNDSSAQRDFSVVASTDSLPGVSIGTIAGDDIVNASEHDQALTVSGMTTNFPEGGKVDIDFNGKAYEATVAADGSWSVDVAAADVAALEDGSYTVVATVTDAAGNEGRDERDFSVTASADSLPTLAIDTIAGDDIVDAAEHGQALTVSGTSTNLPQGDRVNVELNGKAYTATVAADGSWSVDVASADVAALADGDYTVKATATDAAGNEATAQHDFSVAASVPTVTIVGPIAGDDIISTVEHDQALAVDGTATGVAPGTIVRVEIVGVPNSTYLGLVKEDGSFRIGIAGEYVSMLQDGKAQVRAWATNDLGNTGEGFYEFDVVTGSLPVTIDMVTGDDVVDSTEAASAVTVTGSVINAAAGDEVVMKVGGDTYTGVVNEDGTTWSVDIDPVTWSHFKDTDIDVNVTVTNAQGNSGSAVRTVGLDISTPVIYFDTIAEDDIVNASEHAKDLAIGGSVLGLDGGETMYVELNGKTYTTTATADGRWTLNVPAADVSALADGNHTISASVTEEAGNTGTASHDFSVDTVLPTLTVTEGVTRSGDNIVTPDEHGTNLEVFGTSTGLDHDFVYLEIAGFTYNIQTFDDGTWGIVTRRADMATLTDGTYEIKLHATNDVGNVAETSVELVVDAGVPSLQLLSTEAQDSAVVDDQAVAGSVEDDTLESTQADEHFTIGNGGHDSVVYHLLDAADATGGNGADRISGFTVGDGNNTADADRIDLSELLAERRSTEGSDGAETTEAGDLSDYLSVTVKGSDTEIAIDRDGAGSTHEMTTVVTLSGVQTDLATLLANHQLVVS